MEFVILNGDIIGRLDVKIDLEDRGYQFGDGVYEVIRVYNGRMFTVNEHLRRLEESAEKIGIKLPFTAEEIRMQLNKLIERNRLQSGIVYMQFSRGVSPRNHAFPSGEISATYAANTKEIKRPLGNMETGVKAIFTEDIRWLRCDIKSLNLLGNILAKQKAAENGAFEAIQHRGDRVTEGSSSNVSIVKNGIIKTHPADNFILNGITRQKVIGICQENNLPFEELAFTKEDLLNADEIFISSTTSEIMPVTHIEETEVNGGVPGPITRKLQKLFEQEIIKECGAL